MGWDGGGMDGDWGEVGITIGGRRGVISYGLWVMLYRWFLRLRLIVLTE